MRRQDELIGAFMSLARSILRICLPAAALLLPVPAGAQEPTPLFPQTPDPLFFSPSCVRCQQTEDRGKGPPDLTLDNVFTAGWCEPYQPRAATGGAERILLFRTLTPFQDRAILGNYRFADHLQPTGVNESEIGPEVLLPVSSRLMFRADLNYDFNGDNLPGTGGAAGSLAGLLQLIDTPCSALNFQVSLADPARVDLLDHRLFFGLALAGFRDLGARFGLQGSLGVDLPLGSSHDASNDIEATYSIALTKTLTDDVPWIGHFTPFVELAGMTDLGINERHTYITILPGAEWEVLHTWWLATGLEVPLTGPRLFDLEFHLSLIKSF
jgi:hypothetical protein